MLDYLNKFRSKSPLHKLQIVYALLCVVVAPIFSFLIFDSNSEYNNLLVNIALPMFFLGIVFIGLKTEKTSIFFGIFSSFLVLVTLYSLNIVHHSNYSVQNSLGFILVFLGTSICINKWYYVLFYQLGVILLYIIGTTFSTYVIFDEIQYLGILIAESIISIGVLFPMNTILDQQKKFNTYLENLVNEVSHGVIVIHYDNQKIVRTNTFINEVLNKNKIAFSDLKGILSKAQEEGITKKSRFQYQLGNEVFEVKVIPTVNLGKNATHIINLFEITDREKIKNDLIQLNEKYAASRESYKSLFEIASEFVIIFDESFKVVDVNNSYCKKFKLKKSQVMGQPIEDLFKLTEEEEIQIKTALIELDFEREDFFRFQKKYEINQYENCILDTYLKRGKFVGENIYISTSRDISEQVKNKELIETSRDHLAKLLESIDYVVYNLEIRENENNQIRYLSPKTKEIFGLSVDEYIANYKVNKIKDLFHPDDVDKIYNVFEGLIQNTKKPEKIQYRFYNKQKKKYVWIEEKVFPRFENGKHVANFGIATDISNRKEYEIKLKASEEKYKSIYQNNSAGIFYAKEGKMLDANIACAKIMGYDSPKEFIDTPIELHHLNEEKRHELLDIMLTKNEIVNAEWPFRKKDGSTVWTLFNAKATEVDNESAFECTFLDITEERKTSIALQKSEEKYKLLFTEARDTILMMDMDFKILEANDWTVEMFEIEMSQLVGSNIRDFAAPIYEGENIEHELDVICKEDANYFYWIFVSGEGKEIETEVSAVVTEMNDQKVIQMIIRDMSKWVEKEKIIDQSRQSFKNIADYTPEAILVKISDQILYANNNAIELFGATEESIYGVRFIDFFDEENKRKIEAQEKELFDNEKQVSEYLECDFSLPNNEVKRVGIRMLKTIFLGQNANYIFINDLSVRYQLQKEQMRADIAESANRKLEREIQIRIEKEERIKELERYSRSIINSSVDTILVTDNNGVIQESNIAGIKNMGYTEDMLRGKKIDVFFQSENEFDEVKENLLKNKSYIGEFTGKKNDQTTFPAFISIAPLKDDKSKIIGNVSIIRDISEIKETKRQLDFQTSKVKALFETASSSYFWTLDRNYKLTSFNPNFKKLIKHTNNIDIYVGMDMNELSSKVLPDNQSETLRQSFKEVLNGKNISFEGYVYQKNKKDKFWLESYLSPIVLSDSKKVIEVACISHDVNEKVEAVKKIRNSLKEKEVLLKEVHHRVKNNLQVISSILNLQSSFVKDKNTLQILKESQDRIKSMSFIHENLYQTKTFSSIKFSDYIINISKNLVHSYQIFDNFVEIEYDFDEVDLILDQAIPCGLIVNELISNALKHAFDENGGILKIGVKTKKNTVFLSIQDNGKGIPEDFDIQNTESLGLQLVYTLVEQLEGEIELTRQGGTKYLITFEKQK